MEALLSLEMYELIPFVERQIFENEKEIREILLWTSVIEGYISVWIGVHG